MKQIGTELGLGRFPPVPVLFAFFLPEPREVTPPPPPHTLPQEVAGPGLAAQSSGDRPRVPGLVPSPKTSQSPGPRGHALGARLTHSNWLVSPLLVGECGGPDC